MLNFPRTLLCAVLSLAAAVVASAESDQPPAIYLTLPCSTDLDAQISGKTVKLRLENTGASWETAAAWPNSNDRGVFAVEGPGGQAMQFATGYAIYDGVAPAGSGDVWTVAFWLRSDEPDWGVWQQPWSSGRDPKNMFFLTRPMVMHFGTFLSHAWEIRLCQQRLEIHIGDWVAEGTTKVKPGIWTHVTLVRNGDDLAVYVDGQPEQLVQPARVDGGNGALLPPSTEPLPPLSGAQIQFHPSDGAKKTGVFPVLVLGHGHDSGHYSHKFIGAIGSVQIENRAWSVTEIAALVGKDRAQADKLSKRYSVLTDPVGGYSRRADKLSESSSDYLKRMAWWHRAKYGLFMHWNPSSVAGVEISWGRAPAGPMPQEEYDSLYRKFNPTLFDPERWVVDAKAGGFNYMVWTVKHHDGFQMWPSKTSSHNISATPYGKDIVGEYIAALRKARMRVGFYYSPRDWWWKADRTELAGDPATRTNLVAYISAQLRELCDHYGPLDVLWFDGGVGGESEMYRDIIGKSQPRSITNDRNGPGDYVTPEGQIPIRPLINPDGTDAHWENCIPMGNGGWSFHNDSVRGYEELIHEMVETFAKGGNLLRNIGPRPTGEWSPPVVERIKQIGAWLERNGESVYGTHRTRLGCLPFGWATASNTTLCLHVIRWPGEKLTVEDLHDKARSVRLLADGKPLKFQQRGDLLTIDLPKEAPDKADTVIAVRIAR